MIIFENKEVLGIVNNEDVFLIFLEYELKLWGLFIGIYVNFKYYGFFNKDLNLENFYVYVFL